MKRKDNYIVKYSGLFVGAILSCLIVLPGYCQIGINTDNPNFLFHLDGASSVASTNPASGTASALQLSDDVVIDKDGNVGLGAKPMAGVKLDVNGQVFIKGSNLEPEMRLLSDANGYGRWSTIEDLLDPIENVEIGTLYGDPRGLEDPNVDDPDRRLYITMADINTWINATRQSIRVTPGVWLVYSSLGVSGKATMIGNNFAWMQMRDKATGAVLETVGNLHEFTGGGWSKPQFMKLITFTQNTELEIWFTAESGSQVSNRYGGAHFGAIKIL